MPINRLLLPRVNFSDYMNSTKVTILFFQSGMPGNPLEPPAEHPWTMPDMESDHGEPRFVWNSLCSPGQPHTPDRLASVGIIAEFITHSREALLPATGVGRGISWQLPLDTRSQDWLRSTKDDKKLSNWINRMLALQHDWGYAWKEREFEKKKSWRP